jgi:adhesin transport system membrane fusion protein
MSQLHQESPPLLARRILWLCVLSVILLVTWAAFAEIDQMTRAQGSVISSSRTKMLQSLEGGIVAEILVREGDVVRKGQVLLRLEAIRAETSFLESKAKQTSLRAAAIRLKAEIFGTSPQFPAEMLKSFPDIVAAQRTLSQKRQSALNEEIAALRRSQSLMQQELAVNVPLLASGDVSQVEVLRLRRQLADLDGQIVNRRNKYFQDAQTELAKVEDELASTEQIVTQRQDTLGRIEMIAPTDGIVKNVRATTVGGVIKPGDDVLQITPTNDALLIEAKVKPIDVAFLKPGLPAVVKLDAYDYTIYGALKGKLTYISADTFGEENRPSDVTYYRVHIETTDKAFPLRPDVPMEIIPGMTATVEIKTGSNTVLRYLLKPISKATNEAMTER